jgi:hypothetical protein
VVKAKIKVKAKSPKAELEKIFPVVIASISMAMTTTWEVVPVQSCLEEILWDLFFGVLIWGSSLGCIGSNV